MPYSLEQSRQILAEARAAVATKTTPAAQRSEIIYKTRVQPESHESARSTEVAAVIPPQVGPTETRIWWQWVQEHVDSRFDAHNAELVKTLGEVVSELRAQARAHCDREVGIVKRELELTRREAASLRDEVERERALSAKAADIERTQRETEYDLLRRELAVLRGEVGVERGLQALQDAIAEAKSEVPKLPDIEARVEAKLSEMVTAQSCLRGELQKMKDRLGRMRVDQSVADYKLSEFMREQAAAPKTEIEFETSRLIQSDCRV